MSQIVLQSKPLRLPSTFHDLSEYSSPRQPNLFEIGNAPDLLQALREYFTGEENYSDIMFVFPDGGTRMRRIGRIPTATPEVLEECRRIGVFDSVEADGVAYQVEIVEGPEAGKGRHLLFFPLRSHASVQGIVVLPVRWAPGSLAPGHLARIRNVLDLAGTLLAIRRERQLGASRENRTIDFGGVLPHLMNWVRRIDHAVALGPSSGDAEALASLQDVRGATEDMIEWLEDLERLLAIEEGRVEWRRSPVDFNDLLGKIAGRLGLLGRERGISFEIASQDARLRVLGDDRLLETAVECLIRFCLDRSHENRDLLLSLRPSRDAGLRLCLVLPGRVLEKEEVAGYLEPFRSRRVAPGRPTLQLALARAIAHWHAGKLWVESRSSQGTRIYLQLPPALTKGPDARPPSGPGERFRAAPLASVKLSV